MLNYRKHNLLRAFVDFLFDNNENVASRLKIIAISRLEYKDHTLFMTKPTIPFGAAHTYIAHIWQYSPPPPPPGALGLDANRQCMLKWVVHLHGNIIKYMLAYKVCFHIKTDCEKSSSLVVSKFTALIPRHISLYVTHYLGKAWSRSKFIFGHLQTTSHFTFVPPYLARHCSVAIVIPPAHPGLVLKRKLY